MYLLILLILSSFQFYTCEVFEKVEYGVDSAKLIGNVVHHVLKGKELFLGNGDSKSSKYDDSWIIETFQNQDKINNKIFQELSDISSRIEIIELRVTALDQKLDQRLDEMDKKLDKLISQTTSKH